MNIKIAGIAVSLNIENRKLRTAAQKRYKYFFSGSGPALAIDVKDKAKNTRSPAMILLKGNKISIKHRSFVCDIDKKGKKGILYSADNIYHLDSFLRMFYSVMLMEKNGLLLHSCAIAKGDKAAVFSGRSNSGKTTTARLFPRPRVLSDEVVALRKSGRTWYAYSTPFWGEMKPGGKSVRKKLKAVYFLKRGRGFRTAGLSRGESVKSLMRNMLFFVKKGAGGLCIDALSELAADIPCRNFYFDIPHINRRCIDELIG